MHGRELRGLLHPFLLLLIFERPGHGYDLIDRLKAMGLPDVEPGHVYRALRGLERERSVISGWETTGPGPARRCYQLTAKGSEDLRSCLAHLAELDQVIGACLQRSAAAFAGSRRAPHPYAAVRR
ncbi:helix-turn-helix transcriptional regulator [Micromonospora yasonensis]|uniref:helix-turn-helix transcriptional regulator n=1 Tax=Micromonospora yasonensis TaxID=1128667 RepID=UPI00222EB8ED|nr:helix-turn-helix transcriptional regulator [Micromonospora yasonensis]MCW3840558.1 helix-turn-helix transcriptional regulator [Micromonospora yasonensis]